MNKMKETMLLLIVIALTIGAAAPAVADERPVEERLTMLAGRLRLGLSVASIAIYSPTVVDLHLHAQQLVNLLEGIDGRHYVRSAESQEDGPGVMPEMIVLATRFADPSFVSEFRGQIVVAGKNVRVFLDFALDAALSTLAQRRLDDGIREMLRVYAYLASAYETPCAAPRVPALWTILRAFGVVEPEQAEDAARSPVG